MEDDNIAASAPADPSGELRPATVYSPELKLALVNEYLSRTDGCSRAAFSREKGIPASTFDGWFWKYSGIKRGHAKESDRPRQPQRPAPIDVTEALRPAAPQKRLTARITISGVEIEADADGFAMILEALRRC